MIDQIEDNVNADASLVRRGRYVTLAFLLGIGDDEYILRIERGRIAGIAPRRLATESGRFAIRAPREVWEEFWQPVPKPGHHDLWSMLAAGRATLDGDLLPLMQNLQYFKDVLASPRPAPEEG